jgi:hypothetical protein
MGLPRPLPALILIEAHEQRYQQQHADRYRDLPVKHSILPLERAAPTSLEINAARLADYRFRRAVLGA